MVKKVKRKTEELKPYEHNPRRNAKAIEPVSESIKKFGLTNPIIINKDGTILAGHTRLEALKKLGIEEVECILVDGLTKDQERGFRIADNRVGELAEWDKVLLEEEIKEIESTCDLDIERWNKIHELKNDICKDTKIEKSIISKLREALKENNLDKASKILIELEEAMEEIKEQYKVYERNII